MVITGRPPRVLVVYPFEASFVRMDVELLQSFCDVTTFHFRGPADYTALVRAVLKNDIVFCWFAVQFAAVALVLSRLLGRGSVLVAGGFDVSGLPEIGYGRLLRKSGRIEARAALRLADVILAFSEVSAQAIRTLSPYSNVVPVYLGVDLRRFRPAPKEQIVVSVAHVSRENLVRKGLTTFVGAAALVPEARFVLAGRHWDDSAAALAAVATRNVEFVGWLPEAELRELLSRAKVYVQASYTEGFGLALAEGMASGCVPVVTRRGAIPEVVGDAGLYAEYGDVASLANCIHQALQSDLGPEARQRVERLFSIDRRSQQVKSMISMIWERQQKSPWTERTSWSVLGGKAKQ